MPTPLDKIKEGILNNDISLVNDGYYEMTGISLLSSKEPIATKRRKPKIEKDEKPARKPRVAKSTAPVSVKKNKEVEDFRMPQASYEDMIKSTDIEVMPAKLEDVIISRKTNKFVDNKSDFAEEKKISKAPRGAINSKRPPVKNIKVRCGECNDSCVILETEYNPEITFLCRRCLKNKYYGRG